SLINWDNPEHLEFGLLPNALPYYWEYQLLQSH
ncbi:MAG: hypothetical protein ACJAYJ_004850, partial [Saprospiraceae bacterium]